MSFPLQLDGARIADVGSRYVGLQLAVALGREFDTLGFDLNAVRVTELKKGREATGTDSDELRVATKLSFSADAASLRRCNVYIAAVPTPVTPHKWPDSSPLVAASEAIGRSMPRGAIYDVKYVLPANESDGRL